MSKDETVGLVATKMSNAFLSFGSNAGNGKSDVSSLVKRGVMGNAYDIFDESLFAHGGLFERYFGDKTSPVHVSNRVDRFLVEEKWNLPTTTICTMRNQLAINPSERCALNNIFTCDFRHKKVDWVAERFAQFAVESPLLSSSEKLQPLFMKLFVPGMLDDVVLEVNDSEFTSFESALLLKYYSIAAASKASVLAAKRAPRPIHITRQLYYYVRDYFDNGIYPMNTGGDVASGYDIAEASDYGDSARNDDKRIYRHWFHAELANTQSSFTPVLQNVNGELAREQQPMPAYQALINICCGGTESQAGHQCRYVSVYESSLF